MNKQRIGARSLGAKSNQNFGENCNNKAEKKNYLLADAGGGCC